MLHQKTKVFIFDLCTYFHIANNMKQTTHSSMSMTVC